LEVFSLAVVPAADHSNRNIPQPQIPTPEVVRGPAQAEADRLGRGGFGAGEPAAVPVESPNYKDSLAKSGKAALGATLGVLGQAQKVIAQAHKSALKVFYRAMRIWTESEQSDPKTKPKYVGPAWKDGVMCLAKAIDACGEMAVPGTCEEGHEFVKLVQCGRDQCPICGQRGSDAHMRRFARIVPKIQQLDRIGYFVIQYPRNYRGEKRTVAALRNDRVKIKNVFKKFHKDYPEWMGSRGKSSWDLFGDPKCPRCKRPGQWDGTARQWDCKACGQPFQTQDVLPEDMQWNPHQNVLTVSTYIPPEQLTELQRRLSMALVGEFEAEIREREEIITLPNGETKTLQKGSIKKLKKGVILHYEYVEAKQGNPQADPEFIKKALHLARYITKPTFLDLRWDPEMAGRLAVAKFNRMGGWGHWDDEPQWELTTKEIAECQAEDSEMLAGLLAVKALEAGTCPIDGTALTWTGRVFRVTGAQMMAEHWKYLGGGYWQRELQPDEVDDTG